MGTELLPEAALLAWFEELSNWGRWGAADELGTLNLVTAVERRRAAACVRAGVAVSCARDIVTGTQPGDLQGAPHRFMVRTGQGLHDEHRVPVSGAFAAGRPRLNPAAEYLALMFHGPNVTHLDALCHQSWDARMYNGRPAEAVTVERGATELSVLAARDGIVTRGVLVDAARGRGVDWLEPGEGVTPDEVEDMERRTGVEVQPGDALLLRTGYGCRRREVGASELAGPWAGWHPAMLPWLRERDVALVGSDTFNEMLPNGYADVTLPLHAVGIVAMGLWLLDNCDLEALGDAAAAHGPAFLFSLAPLPVEGGTGSPVNPLALF